MLSDAPEEALTHGGKSLADMQDLGEVREAPSAMFSAMDIE